MQTYRQYLESTEDEIVQTPQFKFKSQVGDLVNHLLDQIETDKQDADQILNDINRFKVELEEANEDAQNVIESKRQYLEYLKHYESLSQTLAEFEEPPTNIDPLLDELKNQLNQFYEFVQAQIAL